MTIKVKGSGQVKSLASLKKSGTHSGERHVHFFKVASLELERSRRLKERRDALNRIQCIDQRLREIDTQLKGHYESVGVPSEEEGEALGTPPAYEIPPRPGRTVEVEERPGRPHHAGARQMLVYGR